MAASAPGPDAPAIPPLSVALASGAYGFSDVPLDDDSLARRTLLLVADGSGVELSFAMRLVLTALGKEGPEPWPPDPAVLRFGDQPVAPLKRGFGAYQVLDDRGYQILIDFLQDVPIARSVPASAIVSSTSSGPIP